MRLAVGEAVVYGQHGVGRIAARETRAGEDRSDEVVVLALQNGLTVTLEVTQALAQLRPVADEDELGRIEATLRAEHDVPEGPWPSRKQGLQAKLAAGDAVGLAEIVAEAAERGRLRLAAGKTEPLSPGERSFFLNARKLLAAEIAIARDLDEVAAEEWIDEQIGRPRQQRSEG